MNLEKVAQKYSLVVEEIRQERTLIGLSTPENIEVKLYFNDGRNIQSQAAFVNPDYPSVVFINAYTNLMTNKDDNPFSPGTLEQNNVSNLFGFFDTIFGIGYNSKLNVKMIMDNYSSFFNFLSKNCSNTTKSKKKFIKLIGKEHLNDTITSVVNNDDKWNLVLTTLKDLKYFFTNESEEITRNKLLGEPNERSISFMCHEIDHLDFYSKLSNILYFSDTGVIQEEDKFIDPLFLQEYTLEAKGHFYQFFHDEKCDLSKLSEVKEKTKQAVNVYSDYFFMRPYIAWLSNISVGNTSYDHDLDLSIILRHDESVDRSDFRFRNRLIETYGEAFMNNIRSKIAEKRIEYKAKGASIVEQISKEYEQNN